MNEDISQVIEEKFTRCPECRSFSVRQTTDLTVKEKIRAVFGPVKVHRCDNCSYRFAEYESFSASLKHFFHSLTSGLPGKLIVIVIPIAAAAVLVTILLLTGGKEKGEKEPGPIIEKPPRQIIPAEKPKAKPGEKKEDPIQEMQQKQKPQPQTPSITTTIAGEILLENHNRFGVNWRPLGQGVQITRLANGPLKRAGLMVGDIMAEVDGQTVIGEGEILESARDDVFYGKRTEAMIKVLRGEEALLFKMIKIKE